MVSQIDRLVPLFNGSDYCSWATSMTAYLCSIRLWGIVSGRESRPSDLPSGRAAVTATQTTPAQLAIPAPTQEQVSERQAAQREWVEKDEQALGIIQLQLSHHLHTLIGITAYRTWRSIEDNYGKPGAALIFADFKALNAFRLSGSNPAPVISKMVTLLEHLRANHCQFLEFMQTMILLNALPQKWDHLASVYIQETKVENFSLVSLREQIIGEWECLNAGRASTSANKLSAVKRKGKSPRFDSQKQKTDNNKAEDEGHKPKKHGAKKPKTEKSSSHSHSHLASVASVEPTIVVPPPTPAPPSLSSG